MYYVLIKRKYTFLVILLSFGSRFVRKRLCTDTLENPSVLICARKSKLGHTKTVKGEYCNVVPDHCIDHTTYRKYISV